jgi:GNAT superfamily N-acetyltransferase
MIEIREADLESIPIITELAQRSWYATYPGIISQEQMDFMFGEMYYPDALLKQMEFLKHSFCIVSYNKVDVGFASFGVMPNENDNTYKLHKLYLVPEAQKLGIGKALIEYVENAVKTLGGTTLILNVNRNNKAHSFYTTQGYSIRETIDIPFDRFWLNDYVMEKKLL